MKTFLLVLALIVSAQTGLARAKPVSKPVTCESLQIEANESCEISMCAEYETGEGKCIKDGDFYEGHQICAYDEFQMLIESHNRKFPRAQLRCEE